MKTQLLLSGILSLFFCSIHSQTLTNIQVLQENSFENKFSKLKTELTEGQRKEFTFGAPTPDPNTELTHWQDASTYLISHPEKITYLVRVQDKIEDAEITSRMSTNDALRTTGYVILAHQDESTLNAYLTKYGITGPIATAIRHEIETIKNFIRRTVQPAVIFSATGNIRNIANDVSAAEPGARGTGTLGATFSTTKNIFGAQLCVASSMDTIKAGYGNSILSPMNGKFLKAGSLEWYRRLWNNNSWLHIYTNLASQKWAVDTLTKLYKDATIFGLGGLYHYRLIDGMVSNTEIGLDVEIGLSSRLIDGNIQHLLLNPDDSLKYRKVLPTTRNLFLGLEAGFTLNFGQIVGAMQVFYYPGTEHPVEDLNGLQLSVGISVRGDLLRAFVTPRD